jgi:undecaprenyl diphosphate synthase
MRSIEQSCYWMTTEPYEPAAPLQGSHSADIAVVGAGFTGLWTALFLKALDREVEELHGHGVRIRFVGELSAFAPALASRMHAAMDRTAANTALDVNIAVNYGGRWDIAQAARRIAQAVQSGAMAADAIDEHSLAPYLCLAGQPGVDLFIRTGGEQRVSNFLLWQIAYAEIHFTATLWPDFDTQAFEAALADYAGRERRFGKTSAQIAAGA